MTTFELLDYLITKMNDELNKGNTANTGFVEKEQLLEVKRIAEKITTEADCAIKHL